MYKYKSMEEVLSLQNHKLRDMIQNKVAHFHPFYREMFEKMKIDPQDIHSVNDLEKLPFTTKEDLIKSPKSFILQPSKDTIKATTSFPTKLKWVLMGKEKVKELISAKYRPSFFTATSGRTSNSTPVLFTKADLTMFKSIYAKNARIAGISSEDKFISLFPYAPHLAFWIVYFATEEMGLTGVHTGSVLGTKRQIELSERFECNWLAGTTTYMHYFLSKALEQGAKFKQLRGIITGGERLSDGLRQKIEGMVEQLGGKGHKCVRDGYGVVESKLVAMECSPHSGYHVNPEVIFWECVDPKTGKNIGWDKGGDLAFSHIDGHGTILLRYLIGDQAEGGISYKKCPHCGVLIPRIIGPLGRSDEYCSSLNIAKIKGTTVNLNSLLDFLTSTDHMQEFRVIITKQNEDDPFSLDKLLIEIASKERDHNKLIKQIRDEVKSLTEISPEIIVRDKDDIAADLIEGSLKGNRIVDLRKKRK